MLRIPCQFTLSLFFNKNSSLTEAPKDCLHIPERNAYLLCDIFTLRPVILAEYQIPPVRIKLLPGIAFRYDRWDMFNIASQNHLLKLTAFYALASFAMPGAVFAGPAVDAGFVPHKALYEIDMAASRSGSQIANIDGQMFYEWQPDCEAWSSNHRFKLLYEYADSPPMNIVSDYSTFESFDGKTLNFTSQRKKNGRVVEELRGRAVMDGEEAPGGVARFSLPEGLSYDLPAGTMFPMSHTLAVLEKIRAGEKFYIGTIFDGSDEQGPVQVNAFIGDTVNAMAEIEPSPELNTALINNKAYRVRMAFFPLKSKEQTPDYEMEVTFHENGVISDMLIEYDDFSLRQSLVALEKMPDLCTANDNGGSNTGDNDGAGGAAAPKDEE